VSPRPSSAAVPLGRGGLVLYLSLAVLLPVAAVVENAFSGGLGAFWQQISAPEARSAVLLTLAVCGVVVIVNAIFGTLIAWVLVRDEFPGRPVVDAIVDLPFVLPTIVAGLALLALYGPRGGVGVDISGTRVAILVALLFVTLPFVVRSVQPVLLSLDPQAEQAAASLGARPATIFRRVVLPAISPAIISGAALSFARAVGEFGSLVLITGNLPFKTEVASVYVFGQNESGNTAGAAAVSALLLAIALLVLIGLRLLARRTR
jgi:sulfate transport system permease protein